MQTHRQPTQSERIAYWRGLILLAGMDLNADQVREWRQRCPRCGEMSWLCDDGSVICMASNCFLSWYPTDFVCQ